MRAIWLTIFNCFKKSIRFFIFMRNIAINFIFILFIIVISVCIIRWIQTTNSFYKKSSWRGALLLNIYGTIVDKPSTRNKLTIIGRHLFGITQNSLQENSLFDIVNVIRQAKDDENITGIVLDLKNFIGADQPSMQYIGKALCEFRNSGKPIITIGRNYNQSQYYLASFSNKIWLSPYGRINLCGFATNRLYYKSLLDKLKITTHLFRIGTYKSAVEPFIRDNMSPHVREENSRWIKELWNNYLITIARNRHISIKQVFPGAQEILYRLYKTEGDSAQYALQAHLVDELGYNINIEQALSKQFGWSEKNKSYNHVSIYDYMENNFYKINNIIAVIFVNGTIIDGEDESGNVGADTVAAQIRKARFNPRVKAVILRVNSPGGSVSAAEVIHEELIETRRVGKPVVVSMGGVAASGGYWISTPANHIIAHPNTLTGSIGIFGIINTMEGSLDYLGVHADGVATSPLADATITKSLPKEVSRMMQLNIENGYKRFITLVAKSRNKTVEQINQIAQGKIWTGKDAKRNGLVDSLGDFDDSVAKAVELAKLKEWNIEFYHEEPCLLKTLIDNLSNSIRTVLKQTIKTYLLSSIGTPKKDFGMEYNSRLAIFNDPNNRYAFCPICHNHESISTSF